MLIYNIKTALRHLLKFKSHSVIGLVGLIIGLACVMVITAWTIQELQYDKFHKQSDLIYMVTTDVKDQNNDISTFPETPPPLAAELKEKIPGIESCSHFIYLYGGRVLKIGDDNYKEKGLAADPSFFDVLDFQFMEGNSDCLDQPNTILLTENLAKKLFPNETPIGKDVLYRTDKVLTVQGIIKDIPENSSLQFDFIVPYKIEIDKQTSWWQLSDATFIKIAEKTDISKIKRLATEIWKEKFTNGQYNINFIPITKLRYGAQFEYFNAERGNSQKLYAFISIAILILILACLNYINLVTAYSIKRKREVRIRKVNGASSNNILKYFLTESIIDSIIASFFAVLLSVLIIRFFQSSLDIYITSEYLITSYISGIIGSFIMVGLISGFYPALITSYSLPFHTSNKKLKNAFILVQFVLSITLSIISLVLILQTNFLNNYNVGYNADNVVLVHLPTSGTNNYQTIKTNLLSDPSIEHVSFAGGTPVNMHSIFATENWKWDGLAEGTPTSIYRLNADQSYLDVFQIPLTNGSFFSASIADSNKVVINEKLVALLGSYDPIGAILSRGENSYEIIGVVKDFHFQSLSNEIHPMLFMYSETKNRMMVRIGSNREQSLRMIKAQFFQFYPNQPLSYSFVDDTLDDLYINERRISLGIIIFTLITILLSCIGLIGLVTFNVELKTKEIGIRKVVGAEINEIMILLNKNYLILFIIGFIISCIISLYAMNKWLENFVYKVSLNWWVFVIGGLIIMTIAFLTVSWQTWKAAVKNPVEALKYE